MRREVESLAQMKGQEELAYYSNITGVLRGKWFRIPEPNPNPFGPPDTPPEEDFAFPKSFPAPTELGNFTYRDTINGHEGKFSLDISEFTRNTTIQFVEAVLTVGRGSGDNMFRTRLEGVHFPATGEIVLVSTTARKYLPPQGDVNGMFEGLPLVPYLTSSNDTFKFAKDLISKHIEKSVGKHASYVTTQEDDGSFVLRSLQCDMIVFISVIPSPGISPEALALYESEMRNPTGQRIARPPPLELSGVMYSPDCGTVLEWREEAAVKVEEFWHAGRTVGIVAGLVSGLQSWWVLKEMGERGSPSVPSSTAYDAYCRA